MTALTTSPSTWQATVEGSGAACLCSDATARNVTAVLSRAHTRTPQKTLCALVEAHVPQMLRCVAGTRVLTALVEYGTPRTVDRVAAYVTAADAATWTLQRLRDGHDDDDAVHSPSNDGDSSTHATRRALVAAHARLLERFVYREDGKGAAYDALLHALRTTPPARLFATQRTIAAAARLMLVDAAYARQCAADAAATTALQHALLAATATSLRAAAEESCDALLQRRQDDAAGDGDDEEMHALRCDFVWRAIAPSMRHDAAAHPREALLLSLVTHATCRIVNDVGRSLATWPQLHDLAQRAGYSIIVAVVLERASDDAVGVALLRGVCTSVADVDARLTSRKTALLRVLAAVAARPAYVTALEQTVGGALTAKLHAARVRYTNATTQRAVATAQTIMQKLRDLPSAHASAPRRKRSRS